MRLYKLYNFLFFFILFFSLSILISTILGGDSALVILPISIFTSLSYCYVMKFEGVFKDERIEQD